MEPSTETPAVTYRVAASLDDAARLLILKAGRRWALNDDQRYKRLVPRTELDAFGQVASDVLGICMTPAAFGQSILSALQAHPHPRGHGRTREAAAAARTEWEAAFLAAAQLRLGTGTL